jgi:hypothetical protein
VRELPRRETDRQRRRPPLQGDALISTWKGRSVADLFEKIQTTMPADAPGILTSQQAADVIAFMFALSKFPAGPSELNPQTPTLAAITIR